MKLKQILRHGAAVALLFCAGVANAALYNFDITGDYTAHWQLDSSPVPDDSSSGTAFILYDVPGFADAFFGVADVSFYNAAIGGGVQIFDYYGSNLLLSTDGPQLYTGTEGAPTFTLGSYALTQYLGSGQYTLTISAVPEPATYGMMLAGLGLMGVALRRRRQG